VKSRNHGRDDKFFVAIAENANIQSLVFLSLMGASAAGILVPSQGVGEGQEPPAMVVRIRPDGLVGVESVGEAQAHDAPALRDLLSRGAAANQATHMKVHSKGCDAGWVKILVDTRPSSVSSMSFED